jgi:hypothetical protein
MRESEQEVPGTAVGRPCPLEAAPRIGVLGGEKNHERPDRTEIRLSKL